MHRSTRPNQREYNRNAAGLFAATVVLTGGAGLCLMMTFLFAKEVWEPLVVLVIGLAVLALLMWLLLDRPVRRAQNSNVYLAQKESLSDYVESFEPRHRRREGRRSRSLGNNPPPSAEGLRKIRADSNTWCPSDRRAEEYRKSLEEFEG